MFFGMCNSPVTFQAMMDHIFTDMIERNLVIIYMDDILIFSNTQEELEKITKEVLKLLQDNDLYLKPKKCEFNKTVIKYLGLIIKKGQLSMDPVKLKGIMEWPTPAMVKQLRAFLGFGNFYCQFIQKFSKIAMPLNGLLKKNVPFKWSLECQEAFLTLKQRFTEEPVLMMPDQK